MIISGGAVAYQYGNKGMNPTAHDGPFVEISGSTGRGVEDAISLIQVGPHSEGETGADQVKFTGSFLFPAIPLRGDSMSGSLSNPKRAYFGIETTRGGTSLQYERSYSDLVRTKPYNVDSFTTPGTGEEYSFVFTLDNLVAINNSLGNTTGHVKHISGSRAGGTSLSSLSGNLYPVTQGWNKFTMPLHGGFDGLDIMEKDPFRNTLLNSVTSEVDSSALYTVNRALRSIADPEVIEYNMLAIPGIYETKVTDKVLKVCEDRGDSLALVDLEGDYTPEYEGYSAESSRIGSVDTAINNLSQRAINNSYGCAYYPWVHVRDEFTNKIIWMPPSVVALGTMGSSAARSELWFAPAGFVRGGLTEGSAGIPVLGVRQKLTAEERDKLYSANINPIASFPSEGVVIFGQKTLQVTPSALDRINVRRSLIFIKKEISRIANRILFEQNVQSTWNRFLNQAEPFLSSVKSRLGLEDYKLVLDNTTTTPDLVDRNVIYAKVYLKPAKAVEFIAIDFTITNSGAAFED
jgi:hypothetical protein